MKYTEEQIKYYLSIEFSDFALLSSNQGHFSTFCSANFRFLAWIKRLSLTFFWLQSVSATIAQLLEVSLADSVRVFAQSPAHGLLVIEIRYFLSASASTKTSHSEF